MKSKLAVFSFVSLVFILMVAVYGLTASADEKTTSEKISGESMNNMNYKKATFGAGCFWGVEAVFQELEGVIETSVGFMGGNTKNPTYKDVCYTETNHAEVVDITYDPNVISYTDLLSVFFSLHDPTTLNRQGPDVGSQYRSAIFYHDDNQREIALNALEQIEEKKYFDRAVVTEVTKAGEYYIAEDYHQDYYKARGITPHCGIGAVNVTLEDNK